MADVSDWKNVDHPEHVVLFTASEMTHQGVIDAKEQEMNNLIENDVFQWVDDMGQKPISTKWVITKKETPNGQRKIKARLVARWFEENGDNLRTDSPT